MKYLFDIIDLCKFIWRESNNTEKGAFLFILIILFSPFSCSFEMKAPEINTTNNKTDVPYQIIDHGDTKEYIFKKEIDGEIQTITVTGEGVSVVVNK
jgi:hypothetical protein